jgi:N-acetyltransferase
MTFELQPTLEGRLLNLRPLRDSDFDAVFAVAADPLIWEQHPAHDRWQEPVFRKLFDESMASGGCLVAIDRSTDRIIGWSRYHGYDPEASEVEIGWTFLARSYWGGKFNGEMKRLMLSHALRFVNRVIFVIGENNIRSQRAVERIGAAFAGPMAVSVGRPDRVVYEIRRDRSGPGGAQPPGDIATKRLLLRRWTPDHAPLLKDALDSSLAHLQRWMPWAQAEPTPLLGLRERLATFSSHFDEGKEWLYGIFSPDGARVIGGTGLHPRIGLTGIEIGYWIRESETHQGYATEAASALTGVGLGLPHIDHVEIRCDPANEASAAIPARLGFTCVETIMSEVDGVNRATMVWRMP